MHAKKVQVVVIVLSSLLAWYRKCFTTKICKYKRKIKNDIWCPYRSREWAVCVTLNLGSYFLAFWKSRYFRSYSTYCM